MRVKILNSTPLWSVSDINDQVGYFIFEIKGISRLLLSELQCLGDITIEPIENSLQELKKSDSFINDMNNSISDKFEKDLRKYIDLRKAFYYNIKTKQAEKFIVLTGDISIDTASILALENLRLLIEKNKPIDKVIYSLPGCFKTNIKWGVNLRSLKNFLESNSDKKTQSGNFKCYR